MTDVGAVRRVVTGHDAFGTSIFVSDEEITAESTPRSAFQLIWGLDRAPTLPAPHTSPELSGFFPPISGLRFMIGYVLPQGPEIHEAGVAEPPEIGAPHPGAGGVRYDGLPGMHTTETIDFEVILSGECVLELDDGATVRLRPGDTVVQNGTRHRWVNPGSAPCVFAVVLVGAARNPANSSAPTDI